MVPDITLEVIYYDQPTDFKMEFELCGCINVRFLSTFAKDRSELLTALSKSVVRSRVIAIVGSFDPSNQEYLPKIMAKAVGYKLKAVDKEKFDITAPGDCYLPDTALPLVDVRGSLAGCVLENRQQSIILLTSERELRHRVVNELVCPYLKFLSKSKDVVMNDPAGYDSLDNREEKPQEDLDTENSQASIVSETVEEPITQVVPDVAEVLEDANLEDNAENSDPQKEAEELEKSQEIQDAPDEITEDEEEEIPLVASFATDRQEKEEKATEDYIPGYAILETPLDGYYVPEEEPAPPKKKRKWLRVVISIILVLAVLFGTFFGYTKIYQPIQAKNVYDDMRELYGQIWDGLPEDMLHKFGCLYQTNKDVYGWLEIANTGINYPVVTSANKSEGYYENHLFEGSINSYGTLYTNSTVNQGKFSRNIVIYGNDMADGSMFAALKNFLNLEYYRERPSFSFDTLYLEQNWKIFSVYKFEDSKEKTYIKTEFFDDEEYGKYLEYIKKISVIKTTVDADVSDQIITLVCRTDGKDIAVAARKVRSGESWLVDVSDSKQTDDEVVDAITPPNMVEIDPNEEVDNEDETSSEETTDRFEQSPTSSITIITPNKKPIDQTSSSQIASTNSIISSSKPTSSVKPSSSSQTGSTVTNSPKKLPTLTVTNTFTGEVVSGPAKEILAQIVEAEMGSSYNIEALKAQTVAAYSWLLCHGAASGKAPDAPLKAAKSRSYEAVDAVAGEVAVYNNQIAATYYYAISAGRTANGKDIWGIKDPHLLSVDSSVDKSVTGYHTIRKYSSADVAKWINEVYKIDLLNSGLNKEDWFKCTYDANGVYVTQVDIAGKKLHGKDLREKVFLASRVCTNGEKLGSANVLRSCAYTIEYSRSEDKFVFNVYGYGHGVGMSQAGANMYAKSGWDYIKILKHYYTGIGIGTYYDD